MTELNSTGTRIQSVGRACRLLAWLAERGEATAKEAAFANQLALSTTYHLLNTLIDQGFVAKGEGHGYVVGPSSAYLGRAFDSAATVTDELLGGVREAAERTGETAFLVDWGRFEMRVIASVEGRDLLRVAGIAAGPYEAAHARANGKVLLAHAGPEARRSYLCRHPLTRHTRRTICDPDRLERELEAVRAAAYACDREEFAEGISCVAAPIRTEAGVSAALGLSVPAARFTRFHEQITRDLLAVIGETEFAIASAGPANSEARHEEAPAP